MAQVARVALKLRTQSRNDRGDQVVPIGAGQQLLDGGVGLVIADAGVGCRRETSVLSCLPNAASHGRSADNPSSCKICIVPALTSQVIRLNGAGRCDYAICCYLGPDGERHRAWVQTGELQPRRFELRFDPQTARHQGEISDVRIGTELSFQIAAPDQEPIPWVPIEEAETVFGRVRVPDLDPAWVKPLEPTAAQPQQPGFQILLEATLEGLLADYQGGMHAPQAIEELLELSIAGRINRTEIPERLAEMGYTELMVPVFSSVADRTRLDPKFNYLVYNLSLDWQLGTHREMRELVERFRLVGIELIPDLVFVHQVSNPYDGSVSDYATREGNLSAFQDPDPYLFRDYGTWMFNLADPAVRQVVIVKIVHLILSLDLKKIRVDYIDGLVLQYSKRDQNWGCTLLDELHAALLESCPGLEIIGEAFSTALAPQVQRLIASSYSPRGFQLMETLLRPGYPDLFHTGATVDSICNSLEAANQQSGRESNYAQLHDECWKDVFIEQGRPATPWAYGKMPLGLALNHGRQLLDQHFIEQRQVLPVSIRLTALVTVLGMVMSFRRWMETVGPIALDTGRLDEENHWKFLWSPTDRLNRAIWEDVGTDSSVIAQELMAFRGALEVIRSRLVQLGPVAPNPPGPPIELVHRDYQNGLIALLRWGDHAPDPVMVLANLAPYRLNQDGQYRLLIPKPERFQAKAICCLAGAGLEPQCLLSSTAEGCQLQRPIEPYEVAVFGVAP